MEQNPKNKEKNTTINNEIVNILQEEKERIIFKQLGGDTVKTNEVKKEVITLESIREKALKLIPKDFSEKELNQLLEIAKKLVILPPEERYRLLEEVDHMSREELIEGLKGAKQSPKNSEKV